ncbi:hypothetical protein TD95_000288 [Thielaviopsis punctulata]|uniref:Putative peptidase domain-containing protein n=1 Tax=Thielaviopsis punctulata TaxID=72032 RepID=A0A0F4ZF46_9PEZI|nr:hypothetical protein TD95_000288 [Thielaviopsis punctulata]
MQPLLFLASLAAASPVARSVSATTAASTIDAPFPIHSSCNATQQTQLARGLAETVLLAETAKAHLLKHGHESQIVQKYFGNGTTATALGWYERVISADRGNMTFRCDDPDKNCATQADWAGHWRGDNATQETVICDLSYHKRLYLSSMCTRGYIVAGSPLNTFWATDLLHRVFHVPQISESIVDHFAESYAEATELAATDAGKAARDSDVLQYFAVEVYAHDVAVPGEGCLGTEAEEQTEDETHSTDDSTSDAGTGSVSQKSMYLAVAVSVGLALV